MPYLRIFSYLPNPRIWKAVITARIVGVELDIRGAKPGELAGWLWDHEPRPLSEVSKEDRAASERKAHTGFAGPLHKTDAFLAANPTGSVPCAFSRDGAIGIFESNSIMRAVARLGGQNHNLYGACALEASRIDSFLDLSLAFARDAQHYLLAIGARKLTPEVHGRAADGWRTYLGALEQALRQGPYLCGQALTLADICFICEFALFARERKFRDYLGELGLEVISNMQPYAKAAALLERLRQHQAFAPELLDAIPPAGSPNRPPANHT